MELPITIALFSPLLGFLILLFASMKINRRMTSIVGCGSILISFLIFSFMLYTYILKNTTTFNFVLYEWIPIEGIHADFKIVLDSLSLWMCMIITGVGFLIHLYSIGYMEHDPDFARYFGCLNFFVFSMLLLVLAGNLTLLFVGWEGVGLASYLLIGFYQTKPSANQAATKAFVINRIGDLGFLIALVITFMLFGTGDIQTIIGRAGNEFALGAPMLLLVTMLYFFAATGKSAQIPLYTWLPDAMEGPTPVSALIHAATMVTAGVYLIVRLHPLFLLSPFTMHTIGIIGGVTSLFAALCAVGQTDLKRVLAYSTVSQIGLMFLACGVGAFYPAIFHLTSHAFIKALLFLSAGTEMEQMGGLKKRLPVTHAFFLIGVLALSGIPPLAAFFSKDMILQQEYLAGADILYTIGLVASVLTGFYLTRAYCLTFLGAAVEEQPKAIHEAPKIMLGPIGILAILAAFGGLLGCVFCSHSFLKEFLGEVGVGESYQEPPGFFTLETWLSIVGAFAGVGLSAYIYTRSVRSAQTPSKLLYHAFYVDTLYWRYIAMPLRRLSKWVSTIYEPKFFDWMLTQGASKIKACSAKLQKLQNGEIRSYSASMVIGTVLVIIYLVY